ncbi:MAG: TVP38/TMEM64 family protein [Vulcanibacillus sp.]
MNKKWIYIIILFLSLFLIYKLSGFEQIITEKITVFIDIRQEYGYSLLLFTIPLSILQGVLTFFPIITIITFHILIFGLTEGMLFSFIGSFLGSILCFILGRYLFQDWSNKLWQKRKAKYQKWETYFKQYGMWTIILLRTVPLMPSNMISLMAALSPINFRSYLWSSIYGNISMVWLFSIFSLSLTLDEASPITIGYITYLIVLLVIFLYQRKNRDKYDIYDKQKVT